MKHIQTINKKNLKSTAAKGGCGECQASCQSACKTSCTVANQKCEKEADRVGDRAEHSALFSLFSRRRRNRSIV